MEEETEPSCPVIPLPEFIGPYKILKKIGSGGMGEIFLAIDPFCQRELALKRIRNDKVDQPGIRERFLKEAKIAAGLSHPGIVPIYQIHQEEHAAYYTMPLVRGETLKEILSETLKREKEGLPPHPIGSSIPALMRIFLNICQAVAYSHSQGILHRDLKPDNIIIGSYGEVLILDWGLADFLSSQQEEIAIEEEDSESKPGLTKPGKIAGTLAYLSPERIFGKKASFSSEIYALGVILYRMLTLRLPFKRKNVQQYKRQLAKETLPDPAERAPYRDIPPKLSYIAGKCLAKRPEKRYAVIEDLLADLRNYIEGHPEWVPKTAIRYDRDSDWIFRENIVLSKHLALKSEISEWVNVRLAKEVFSGNIRIETHVHIQEEGKGLGFLLNAGSPEKNKDFFQDAFFLWIGSEKVPGSVLFRSNAELLSNPEIRLKPGFSHEIRIEKTDYHIRVYLDRSLVFDYLSYILLNGPRFGIVVKDADLDIGTVLVSESSPNILINCLSVPDTLLTLHRYKEALEAYRQIAKSFPGRPEGKEAIFRAGIVLLEEGKIQKKKKIRAILFEQALEEFNLLRTRGGSPLEYLGKSLVYQATKEPEEERKCLELACKRFDKHPLLSPVKEQIIFRLYESSYREKLAAYEFALLALRYVPDVLEKKEHEKLFEHLRKDFPTRQYFLSKKEPFRFSLELAFRTGKTGTLVDLFRQPSRDIEEQVDILYALALLGCRSLFVELLETEKKQEVILAVRPLHTFYTEGGLVVLEKFLSDPPISFAEKRVLFFCLEQFLTYKKSEQTALLRGVEKLDTRGFSKNEILEFQKYKLFFLFFLGEYERAEKELLSTPNPLKEFSEIQFRFFTGCLKAHKEGIEAAEEYLEDDFPSFFTLSRKSLPFFDRMQHLQKALLLYRCAEISDVSNLIHARIKRERKLIESLL